MKYAKLEEGRLFFSTNRVVIGEEMVFNPTPEQLIELGYKPYVESEKPEYRAGYYYLPNYEETETEVRQVWEEHEIPEMEQSDGDYMLEKFGLL